MLNRAAEALATEALATEALLMLVPQEVVRQIQTPKVLIRAAAVLTPRPSDQPPSATALLLWPQ